MIIAILQLFAERSPVLAGKYYSQNNHHDWIAV